MNYTRHLACITILIFLASIVAAVDDQGSFLNPDDHGADKAAKQDEKDLGGGKKISSSQQDALGNATTVITGKNMPSASVNMESSMPKGRLLSPSNKWNIDLQDTVDRTINLDMYLSNDAIFGKGTIVIGNVAQNATATGTFHDNKFNLDILSSDLTLYRLALTRSGKSISGDYHGYSPIYVTWKGIAMGKID